MDEEKDLWQQIDEFLNGEESLGQNIQEIYEKAQALSKGLAEETVDPGSESEQSGGKQAIARFQQECRDYLDPVVVAVYHLIGNQMTALICKALFDETLTVLLASLGLVDDQGGPRTLAELKQRLKELLLAPGQETFREARRTWKNAESLALLRILISAFIESEGTAPGGKSAYDFFEATFVRGVAWKLFEFLGIGTLYEQAFTELVQEEGDKDEQEGDK